MKIQVPPILVCAVGHTNPLGWHRLKIELTTLDEHASNPANSFAAAISLRDGTIR